MGCGIYSLPGNLVLWLRGTEKWCKVCARFQHTCLLLPLCGISLVLTYSHTLRRAPVCVPTKPHQASSFSCAVPVSLSPDKLPSGFFCSWDLFQHNFCSPQSSSAIGVKLTCTSWRFVLQCGRRNKNSFTFILFLSSSRALVEIGVVNKFLSLHSGEAYRVTEWIWIMLMKEFFSSLPPLISKCWTLKILDWVCVSSDASLFSGSILAFCKKLSGFLTWRNGCELEVHLIIFLMCVC